MLTDSKQAHYQIHFSTANSTTAEILSAILMEYGATAIQEIDNGILAFFKAADFNEAALRQYLDTWPALQTIVLEEKIYVPPKNWNSVWEENFSFVSVANKVLIKAPFHTVEESAYTYVVKLNPKMAFGTGHHETTYLMADQITEPHIIQQLKGQEVLDFGSGTGILAILCLLAGASHALAIDIDEWAYDNAHENATNNGVVDKMTIVIGNEEAIPTDKKYPLILANINRHVLLNNMALLASRLTANGILLISGILTTDENLLLDSAQQAGLQHVVTKQKGNWLMIEFVQQNA